jgi:hypothetical protein
LPRLSIAERGALAAALRRRADHQPGLSADRRAELRRVANNLEAINRMYGEFRRSAAAHFAETARRHMRKYQPEMYRKLEEQGGLERYVQELGTEAATRQEVIEAQYLQKNPAPPDGADRAQHLAWAALSAQEIVLHEMILLPDEETARAIREGGYRD